jgi:mannose-1-phosphate guanylyltransferase
MFTGVHILSADAIADLPASGCIIRHSYRRWVDSGRTVAAIVDESPWRDLGTLSEYLQANLDLASGALRSPLVTPDPTRRAALVDPSASIGQGARIERSVVGPGAHIAPNVRLTRSVVWDGCRVDVDADGVCVAPNGITAIL